MSGFTQEELDTECLDTEHLPRKSLGFKCTAEWFTQDAFDYTQQHAALFAFGT